ncbi:MAG TPA: YihY/virulence factor BrkB family protein [Terracidiphilus sp.]
MRRYLRHFRKAVFLAIQHDVLNTAKASAYSGMLMFFPAFIVITALIAKFPEGPTAVGEIRWVSGQILPADTVHLMLSSMQARNPHPGRLIWSGIILSIFAALGLMLTLMEGFRRAYRLPRNEWGFWERRIRALFLVFIVLVPLALATILLVFGRAIELWMVFNAGHELRYLVLFLWRMARWSLAFGTTLAVVGALYHFGTKRGEHWMRIMPGAMAASAVWFSATLTFGWYVTRIADYTIFYGSFGAGIATLVWLYITSFTVLLGAELNGVFFRERNHKL